MTKKIITREGGQNSGRQVPAVPAKAGPRMSDAALILLGTAASRADGLVLPPPASCRARGKALERVLGALLKTVLVREVPVATDEQSWRRDETGNRIGLEIANDGRCAIGMPAPKHKSALEGRSARQAAASGKGNKPQRSAGSVANHPMAEERLSAWAEARSALPGPQRRTKQAQLVGLLSEPAGQTATALGQTLGWQPHTVRAALTGLRQKGYALSKSKDQSDTTVYRIEGGAGTSSADAAPKAA